MVGIDTYELTKLGKNYQEKTLEKDKILC